MKKTAILLCLAAGILMSLPEKTANATERPAEAICSISCSLTKDGITYYANAGSIFTSCSTAADRCAGKLAQLM